LGKTKKKNEAVGSENLRGEHLLGSPRNGEQSKINGKIKKILGRWGTEGSTIYEREKRKGTVGKGWQKKGGTLYSLAREKKNTRREYYKKNERLRVKCEVKERVKNFEPEGAKTRDKSQGEPAEMGEKGSGGARESCKKLKKLSRKSGKKEVKKAKGKKEGPIGQERGP